MCNGRDVILLQHVLWERGYMVITIPHTLGTSLLTIAMANNMVMHLYRAIATYMYVYRTATMTGQTPLEHAKTVRTIDESDCIASYQSKAEI